MLATRITDVEAALNEWRAAEMLGISVRTLQTWRLRGGGPQYLKLGRSVRYRTSDLLAFMDRCVASQAGPSGHSVQVANG